MADDFSFCNASGEMVERLRSFDWKSTILGPPSSWPESLRLVLGICFNSSFPLAVWWGPELIQFYNDGYRPILGATKHPDAFGRTAKATWPDIWPEIGPMVDQVMTRGEAVKGDDMPLVLERNGYPELCYFTFSYSPICDSSGNIAGMFTAVVETTDRVLTERKAAFQTAFSDRLRALRMPDEITAAAAQLLGQHLSASRVYYGEIDDATKRFTVPEKWIASNDLPDLPATGSIEDFAPALLSTLRAGNAFVVDDLLGDERTASWGHAYAALDIRSIIAVPLIVSGRLRAVFSATDTVPRHWTSHEISEVTTVAERTWSAAESARIHAELRRSEQRAVEAAAQADRERHLLDALLAAAPVGIVMADANGRIMRVNPANRRIWGETIPFSESMDDYANWKGWRTDDSEKPAHRFGAHDWPMSRALHGEEAPHDTIEIEPFGEPGVRRTIFCSAAPIRNGDGVITGAVVAQMDITERVQVEAALRSSEAHLWTMFEQTAAGIAETDLSGHLTIVNNRYCQILGRTREELVGQSISTIIHSDDRDENMNKLWTLVKTGESFDIENRYQLPDGSPVWVSKTVSLIRAGDNKPPKSVLAVVLDITERKRAEKALREQTDKLQLATEAAELGLFDHDLATAEISWNAKTREHFGVPADVKITRELLYGLIHPDDRERVRHTHRLLMEKQSDARYAVEYRVVTPDGKLKWIAATGKITFSPAEGSSRLVGTIMDITERKRTDQLIHEAAQHDSLTGLPNRALLYEYCGHILAMSARFGNPAALLFIDLDRFKAINDLYGHDVGDKVLKEVAQRLLACSRKEDIVSRLGGDEFIVVLPRITSPEDPAVVAAHMLEAVSQPISINALQLEVSPSIGISLFPEHADDLELLIRCADMAMYAAKKDGRNNVKMYSSGLTDHADGLLRLEILLKHAMETNRLMLFYQPILEVDTRELVGAEALVRIPSEDGTLLGPADFIAIAEATGLMNRMGEWVVREACRQHRVWRDMGLPPITIAVNVSPTQFRQPGFASMLAGAIAEFVIDPACFQLEVTESTVMHNVPETIATLSQLQSMGIKIALDDFGTGYSSLSHLSNLPLDKLKIDQSFIQQMSHSETSRSITEAIVGLGQTLNLKVVGEGVESEASLALLHSYGCNQAQGFLFSRPLPADEFELWYRNHLE